MRDRYAYVQSHLGSLDVARVKQEEVDAELAAHLEEYYSSLRSTGMAEEDAFLQTVTGQGTGRSYAANFSWYNGRERWTSV